MMDDLHTDPQKTPQPDPAAPESPSTTGRTLRISLNAPFVLGFSALALLAMILSGFSNGGTTRALFSLPGNFEVLNPFFYLRLILYPAGHADWAHFLGNFTLVLLVGPLLEEKYGTFLLIVFSVVTAVVTGLLHVLLFQSPILGASGIVFMMILLTSLVNVKRNTIPLTFILVAVLFLGKQVLEIFQADRVSQFAHIVGGICGGALGFWWEHRK